MLSVCKHGALFLLSLSAVIFAHPQEEVSSGYRRGKIFNFWNGFEQGLRDTADVVARVSDNLEVAIDQVTDGIGQNINTFADRLGETVGTTVPSFLRRQQGNLQAFVQPFSIDGIGGSFGGAGDFKVFYPGRNPGLNEDTDPTRVGSDGEIYAKPTSDLFNQFNPFGSIGNRNFFELFNRGQPWYKGENVCIDREETDEQPSSEPAEEQTVEAEVRVGDVVEVVDEVEATPIKETVTNSDSSPFSSIFSSFHMSSCSDDGIKYTCVTKTNLKGIRKTLKVTYRCCHSFIREDTGCTKINLFPLAEMLEIQDDTTPFLRLLEASNLISSFEEANLTLFVPTKEAIDEYTSDMEEQNEITKDGENILSEPHSLAPVLLGHATEGFFHSGDFEDEMILPSLNEGSSIMRLNIYGGRPNTVTVNCARIISANRHSWNGVVHTIDRVIEPVDKSIADFITSDPQFSILKQLLSNTGLVEKLRNEGQITLFAPTDAAFRKLDRRVLNSLLAGSSCLEAVLQAHMLPNTICSASIQGRMQTQNLLKEFLIVERDVDDKLFVEESQIVARDLVATNGVVHIIDKALIPNQAKSVSEVLEYHNLTRFMDLLKHADLMDEFNAQSEITVFAPSNKAFDAISEEELQTWKDDKDKLRQILRYHVAKSAIQRRDINNNEMIETTEGKQVRMNLYNSVPILSGFLPRRDTLRVTAGCARVSLLDSSACGAVVHVVEEVMRIPKDNVLDELSNDYSIFRQMIKDSEMDEELSQEGPFTVLAPSDHVFKTFPEEELNQITSNPEVRKEIIRSHILKEHVCCSGINSNHWLFMDRKRTLNGAQLHVRRSSSGRLMAGRSRIISCGSPARNGVVHELNRMVLTENDLSQMLGNEKPGRIFKGPNLNNIFYI